MYTQHTLCSSSILSAHIRQDVSLIFIAESSHIHFLKKVKKYGYLLIGLFAFFGFQPDGGYAASLEKDFVVTAYYSPLPGQSFYLRGNYEAEKLLNGDGTHGASGKPVFPGMIAAPKGYGFGTRIEFNGLGVGIVEDRGGAIVPSGAQGQAYDRIDIWMGSGEEGLRRALIWGKRKVKGRIVTDESLSIIDLKNFDSGKIDLTQFSRVSNQATNVGLPQSILDMFADLGYPKEDGETERDMIIEFQIDHGIISHKNDEGAGVYGPKTRATLADEYKKYITLRDAELAKIEAEKSLLLSEKNAWESSYKAADVALSKIVDTKIGDRGEHVRTLQMALKSGGYYRGNTDGIMTRPTVMALKTMQKKNGISATGLFDTRTRHILLTAILETK